MTHGRELLLDGLKGQQHLAVKSPKRRVLVVAGAGSGKTEVMARRIAWWVGVEGVPKDAVIAFTFTERAAEELKFRIRAWLAKVIPEGTDIALGGMYIGTIHGFCLAKLREFWPDDYHNYDVLDEGARAALVLRGFNGLLGLQGLRQAIGNIGQYATVDAFLKAYDQLQEHDRFDVELPPGPPPYELGAPEREWCKKARLTTNVGETPKALAFAVSAARYYAYLRCRRFLDFSTSQREFVRRLADDRPMRERLAATGIHLVVDEVQDINPVQRHLIELLVGNSGKLAAVGDHRQAIYGFRGATVEIVAELWERFQASADAEVIDLTHNFRSTPRIIDIANKWAETIGRLRTMRTPHMTHGNAGRLDHDPSHVALVSFADRGAEARWIAAAIGALVPSAGDGARHDRKEGGERGIALSDIAVLVRSSTGVRTYMQALEAANIPCVVRAGPDLFSQPEVLLFLAALAVTAGMQEFIGSDRNPKSMPSRIKAVLGCGPHPEGVLKASGLALRRGGLPFEPGVEQRLLAAAAAVRKRLAEGTGLSASSARAFRSPRLRQFLTARNELRRVFPQQLFHLLLSEAEVDRWDTCSGRGQAAMFHLGALSGLITGLETPGWTSREDYVWQIIGLCQFGAESGRTEEQPLMVQPEAVTISTIHAVKGLEFAAVFLADVCAQRFPSGFASRVPDLPLDGRILDEIDVVALADNANNDAERRLMYVAVTRAERFLFISRSGPRTSKFVKELSPLVRTAGGMVTDDTEGVLKALRYAPKEHQRDVRISTSFSDLRYYLECPHDFYLRKVLGFAPTIDQAFGYGRGVHNLMRAIHSDPKRWAALAGDPVRLEREIGRLIGQGLFYLRYTTGEPAEKMRAAGTRVVGDYVRDYSAELASLSFEPEREFETLIEYEDQPGGALIGGAIDVVRQDDPPRVTLIDFKSGDADSDKHHKLDDEEMKLQVTLYALAAKRELEYQPEQGLVRYLGEQDPSKKQLKVKLDADSLAGARRRVAATAAQIRDRRFDAGPVAGLDQPGRCGRCDFLGFCGMKEAARSKRDTRGEW